jgi:hypothetical protein
MGHDRVRGPNAGSGVEPEARRLRPPDPTPAGRGHPGEGAAMIIDADISVRFAGQ